MSAILVDTSAYSAFRRGNADVMAAIQAADRIFVSATVLGELRAGFAGGSQRERNESELRTFLGSPRVAALPVDEDTSVFYAAIYAAQRRSGNPIPANDLWIASTCMQHGLRLLTTDAHFGSVKQIIVDCCVAAS